MFRKLRIMVLLLLLIHVGVGAWLVRARTASWQTTLRVAVFPIAADDSPRTAAYLNSLDDRSFAALENFVVEEAKRFAVPIPDPIDVQLGPRLAVAPPVPPFGGSRLEILLWSLELRWWVWRHGDVPGPSPHVRLFVQFHDPLLRAAVPHSIGLPQGLIGVVHVFADRSQAGENAVVMAHELMHTLGATDKYDPDTNLPRYPDGYAEPDRVPREPQAYAEIMGGRVPVSPSAAEMPRSLDAVLVGVPTAQEIGWRR